MSDEFEPPAGVGDDNPQMESPGAHLREVRESHDLTLGQVALSLHVNESLLKSLEKDDYTALGAPIFVKGHLRNYAKLLEIDAAQVIRMYEKYHQPVDPALSNRVPDGPRMEHGGSGAWLRWVGAILLFILLVVLAGWWYYRQEAVPSGFAFERESSRVDPVEMLADHQPQPSAVASDNGLATGEADRDTSLQGRAATGEPDEGTDDKPADVAEFSGNTGDENADDPATASSETSRPAPVRETADPSATQAPAQATTRAETDVPQSSRDAGSASAGSANAAVQPERRIVLEFIGESWVEVYDSENQPLLYNLEAEGAQRTLEVSGPIRLFLGNAPEVRITVDGESFDVVRFTRRDNTARFRIPPER